MPGLDESQRIATHEIPGASVCNISKRFGLRSGAIRELPVKFPPGRARLATRPTPTGSIGSQDDWDRAGGLLGGKSRWRTGGHDDIDLIAHQLCRQIVQTFNISFRGSSFKDEVSAFHITKFRQ